MRGTQGGGPRVRGTQGFALGARVHAHPSLLGRARTHAPCLAGTMFADVHAYHALRDTVRAARATLHCRAACHAARGRRRALTAMCKLCPCSE